MQPPTPNASVNGKTAQPGPASSPFISLSVQCDLLNFIGGHPHSYAAISEQSVYSRAADQLRFHTPSPLRALYHNNTDASPMSLASGDTSPRVCMSTPPPLPFPSIHWFEQRAAAEEKEGRGGKQGGVSPSPANTLSGVAAAAAASPPESPPRSYTGLLPSATNLAISTYRLEFPSHGSGITTAVSSESNSAPSAVTSPRTSRHAESAGEAKRQDQQQHAQPEADVSSLPVASPPTLATLYFSPPVLMRAVAQMVLTMQTSQQNSAASFALAQYRGVQLPAWTRAVEQTPSLSAALPRLSSSTLDETAESEALVFTVLPQVVAERHAPAVMYALTPHVEEEWQPDEAAAIAAGRKRDRASSISGTEKTHMAPDDVSVVAGPVCCARLCATLPTPHALPLKYSAVTPDVFRSFHHVPTNGSQELARPQLSSADTTVYDSESQWLSHGVFHRLFSFPATTPSEASVEERRGMHATFVKTNAFLFLAFLVHHTWCLHVQEVVGGALAARLAATKASGAVSKEALLTRLHVTCLPELAAARRSPQHEWKSELTYRLVVRKRASASASGATPWLWQLTVSVHNRSADLQWRHCGGATGAVHVLTGAVEAAAVGQTLAEAFTGKAIAAVESTGTLDQLTSEIEK